MKILDKNGKEHETVEACLAADAEIEKAEEARKVAEVEKKSAVSKRKKELADAVQKAQDNIDKANDAYNQARNSAIDILKEAQDKADKIVNEAEAKLEEAYKEKVSAIQAFNNEFGTYMVTYTGNEALNEWNRQSQKFTDMWNSVMRKFFY